jgi:hypothetical protein
MNFLNCEPNLANEKDYIDEADLFFADPSQWLEKHETLIDKSTYIVLFENLYNKLANSVENLNEMKIFNKFYICNKFFYSYKKQTENTDKKLFLLCLKKLKFSKINLKNDF